MVYGCIWAESWNLRSDGIDAVMQRYEADTVPGLQVAFQVPVSKLARAYGRPEGRLVYTREDLIRRWLRVWCMQGL